MRIKNKKSFNRKYIFIAVLALITIAVAGTTLYALTSGNSNQKETSQKEKKTEDTFGTVDYSPATEADKKYNDSIKQNLGSAAPDDNGPGNGEKTIVNPIIVDAGQYGETIEVRSIIEKVVENGTCSLTFTQGSSSFTKEVKAVPDAATTRCTNLELSQTDFSSKGTWKVVVTYTSSSATGKSQAKEFEIR